MKFLDFLKKKKKPAFVKTTAGKEEKKEVKPKIVEKKKPLSVKPRPTPKKKAKKEGREVRPSEIKPGPAKISGDKEKEIGLAWRVLEKPHISEKATDLTKENKYIFRVFLKSNKREIKKAVEDIYGVNVLNVKIINIPGKRKTRGRVSGWKKGYKKAIVKIKEGQKIELLPR